MSLRTIGNRIQAPFMVMGVAATLSLLAPPAASAQGQDWPQWRGPLRDGSAPSARLPQKWPEKLPAAKWRHYVGIGYSSPVVADGQVYIMGRESNGTEACLALSDATGKEI